MTIDIRVPEAGESITQVELARWLVEDGTYVEKDQEIAEIDSDKATLTINAEAAGLIKITVEEGTTIAPGKIIGQIDTGADRPGEATPEKDESGGKDAQVPGSKDEEVAEESVQTQEQSKRGVVLSPQARKTLEDHGLPVNWEDKFPESKRITKRDILEAISHEAASRRPEQAPQMIRQSGSGYRSGSREEDRQKMSTLRKKVAERLVAVKNQTAMLTTFNEVDMSAIMNLRNEYQQKFIEKYGIKLGFMSFFVKAVTESIPSFPEVNGYIDGHDIVIPAYADIGIAVSTPKGLMVPVIRNADSLSIPQLESKINELAEKARNNKITIEELSGGTFSVTNGGVFGSMLSTPIINPPQSAILGMHNIIERPVAIGGRVEIRPMMYVALSYDHRIIDGKESVSFLVSIKEMIENPVRMLLQGEEPGAELVGL